LIGAVETLVIFKVAAIVDDASPLFLQPHPTYSYRDFKNQMLVDPF